MLKICLPSSQTKEATSSNSIGDKNLYAGLVLVNTKVKVIYGFGYGTALLGQALPVNDKILAMAGEYNATRQPTVFAFEPTIRNKTDIIAFTAPGIEANLTTAGPDFRLPLARALTQ